MASVTKREWTTPDGETKTAWVCRYTDQEGKRRLKTFEKKKDADQFRTETAIQIERGVHIPDRDALTVKEVCTLYLQNEELRRKDGRIGGSQSKKSAEVVVRIVEQLGRTKFKDLTVQSVIDFYRHLMTVRRNNPRTAKARLRLFAAIEKYALKRKLIREPVVAEALAEIGALAPPKIETVDIDQLARILKAADDRPRYIAARYADHIRLAIHLAAFCGLRKGEIHGLRVDAIDFENGEILISHSWSYDEGRLKSPKTRAGHRTVPMPPHVAALLQDWLRKHYRRSPQQFLFTTSRGGNTPVAESSFANRWHATLKRAGLWQEGKKNLNFHALRHFFASLMIEDNMPLTDLARIIGHSSPNMTMSVYAHTIKGRGRQNHDAIARSAERVLLAPPTIEG